MSRSLSPKPRHWRLCFIGFGLHFFLVLIVASRDLAWLIARGTTVLPPAVREQGQSLEQALAATTNGNLGGVGARHLLRGYLHLAGIESGYSYFAPNVGDSYKLVFELEYPDGHLDYDSFLAENREDALRFSSLLEQVAHSSSPEMRDLVVKLLAEAVWRRYPEVVHIKAVLGASKWPRPNEYLQGKRESFDVVYACDFQLPEPDQPPL